VGIIAIRNGAIRRLHQLFQHYTNVKQRENAQGWNALAADEAHSLLERLDWLLWQIRFREQELLYPWTANERHAELLVEIPTLAESWYYLAFRTMRLIQRQFAEFNGFEVLGITLTRNKLLEHIDQGGVWSSNWSIGDEAGPVVKGPRFDDQTDDWPDAGVYTNAREFDVQLRPLLMPFMLRDVQEAAGVPVVADQAGAETTGGGITSP
jgi:hypothetical protein